MKTEGDDDVNVTDQDTLSAEDLALEAQMRADGDGNPDDDGKKPAPPAPAPKKVNKTTKQAAPKQPAKVDGEKTDGDADEGDQGDGGEGGDAGDGKTKMVPHQALHETREELKAARLALTKQQEESAATLAKAMERFEKTLQAFAPKKEEPKPEPVPDFETDPAGWIAHQMTTTGKKLDEVEGELKTLRAEKAEQGEVEKSRGVVKAIFDYAVAQENDFKAKTPDYDDASKFLIQGRQAELAAMGYDKQQVSEMINIERLTIAHRAKEQGKNPAEIVYNIAKTRGYVAKAPETEEEDEEEVDQGQQQQQQNLQRLDNTKKGRQQDQSLSGSRGNAPSPLTAQRLLEMSEADFDKFVNTPEGRALMGN